MSTNRPRTERGHLYVKMVWGLDALRSVGRIDQAREADVAKKLGSLWREMDQDERRRVEQAIG